MNKTYTKQELTELGAVYEKKENKWGETKTGWWIDNVYLGRTRQDATEAILG